MYKILVIAFALLIISCSSESEQPEMYDYSVESATKVNDTSVNDTSSVSVNPTEPDTPLGVYLRGQHKLVPVDLRKGNPVFYKITFSDKISITLKMIDSNGDEQLMKIPIEMIRVIEDGTISEPYIKFRWNYQTNKDNSGGIIYIIENNIDYINIVANKELLPQFN